jgi:competence protein ComEC
MSNLISDKKVTKSFYQKRWLWVIVGFVVLISVGVAASSGDTSELEKQLNDQKILVAELNSEIEASQNSIETLQGTVETLENTIETLESTIDEKDQEIKQLNDRVAERDKSIEEISKSAVADENNSKQVEANPVPQAAEPNPLPQAAEANPVPQAVEPNNNATSPVDDDVTVYITNTGSKYHRDGCRYLSKSKIPTSLSSAKQSYGPCSVCKPPS